MENTPDTNQPPNHHDVPKAVRQRLSDIGERIATLDTALNQGTDELAEAGRDLHARLAALQAEFMARNPLPAYLLTQQPLFQLVVHCAACRARAQKRYNQIRCLLHCGAEDSMVGYEWDEVTNAQHALFTEGVIQTPAPYSYDAAPAPRPPVVVLCGSTRFKEAFDRAAYEGEKAGEIVLSVGFAPGDRHGGTIGITEAEKIAIDALHLQKVWIADRVRVLNVGGYIGTSTRREILYAVALNKPIEWLEPDKAPDLNRLAIEARG